MSKPEFVYVTYIKTTPERLWEALTSSAFSRRYWFGTELRSDFKAGSPLALLVDGKATDGNPEMLGYPLRNLSTADGNVLFFNAHLSSKEARPVEYPSQETDLPDPEARILFRMSSILPAKLREAANKMTAVLLEQGAYRFGADELARLAWTAVNGMFGSTMRSVASIKSPPLFVSPTMRAAPWVL